MSKKIKKKQLRSAVCIYDNALELPVARITGGYASDSDAEMWSWDVSCDMIHLYERLLMKPEQLTLESFGDLPPLLVSVGDLNRQDGIPHVFGGTSSEWLVVSAEFKELIERHAGADASFYPVKCCVDESSRRSIGGMYIMCAKKEVDCIVQERSTLIENDMVIPCYTYHEIDVSKIPSHARVFCAKYTNTIYIRSSIVQSLIDANMRYMMAWRMRIAE